MTETIDDKLNYPFGTRYNDDPTDRANVSIAGARAQAQRLLDAKTLEDFMRERRLAAQFILDLIDLYEWAS